MTEEKQTNMSKWKKWIVGSIGAFMTGVVLVLSGTMVAHPAVSQLVGLAVAQTSTLWNNVKDASAGDGLSSGILTQSSMLYNGLTFDRMRSAPAADGSAGTGLMANVLMVYNGTTYDRARGGFTADASAGTGLINNGPVVFNGSTWDRMHTASADTLAITGIVGNGNMVWNGTSFDRMRTASADGLAVTGMQASGQMVWNGASNDRQRSASATNNTAATSLGGAQVTQLSTWSVTSTVTGAAQATASKATGGGTIRHVATGITICGGDTAVAVPRQINLRDGATGAGTIIRSWWIGVAVANDTKCIDLAPINMTGTANTAMTLEFAAAGAATSSSTVTLTGYSTP